MTTIQKLINKANGLDGARMPSLIDISILLSDNNIKHDNPSKAILLRTRGCGIAKNGYSMRIYKSDDSSRLFDTTDSYYSINSKMNSQYILNILNIKY
jgi:hypothetical protein